MWGSSSETEQGLGEGAGSECYQVQFLFTKMKELWRRRVGMVAQQCECT